MQQSEMPNRERAASCAGVACAAFEVAGNCIASTPSDRWHGPTGCADWDFKTLAGHIVGEAVWFPNLVRGATRDESPIEPDVYEQLKELSPADMGARTVQAARDIRAAIEEASDDDLERQVDLGFARMPVWQATLVAVTESVFHEWDTRAGTDPVATIPDSWARVLAGLAPEFGPMIGHRDRAAAMSDSYLLRVGDGIGDVSITFSEGNILLVHGASPGAIVTAHLSADQYCRLLAGRLLADTTIQADTAALHTLQHVFGGIANG